MWVWFIMENKRETARYNRYYSTLRKWIATYKQLREEVIKHYHTIRKHAVKTNESIYSCGWLLDIARGIYTLRTGRIISKTRAGEWVIEQGLCPIEKEMIKTLEEEITR